MKYRLRRMVEQRSIRETANQMSNTSLHTLNIFVHVFAGSLALIVGFVVLALPKGTVRHTRLGRRFVVLGLVVTGSAALGLIVFRFMPLFAVLTVLVLYQLIGGWRMAKTKERGPEPIDAMWTVVTVLGSVLLVPFLLENPEKSPSVVFASLGGLATVLIYDTARWFFPRRWWASLWQYEHVYKLNGSLFGMFAAFVGNTVRWGQPWSQLLPSLGGFCVTLFLFYRIYRKQALPNS